MKRFLANPWFQWILRLLIGGVFIVAGVLKLKNPQAFADSIASFQLLPGHSVNLLALCLPPFEILMGFLLIVGWNLRAMALGIIGLTTIFAIALLSALLRGIEVDCGCFGGGEPSVFKTWMSLARDLLLLLGAVFVHRAAPVSASAYASPDRPAPAL